jgi:hypothetical protein
MVAATRSHTACTRSTATCACWTHPSAVGDPVSRTPYRGSP